MKIIYDQGTLLTVDAPHDLPTHCPDFLWDPRVEAFRAPAYRYSKIIQSLQSLRLISSPCSPLCPLPCVKDDSVLQTDNPYLHQWNLPELRPYQATALESWQTSGFGGVIVIPTGGGKTLLAFAAMRRTGSKALCLVPTRALLEQWNTELKKYYSGPIGIQGDGSYTLEAVTVSTYESSYRGISEYGNRFDLLIVDECHHFGYGIRDEILKMSPAKFRLGLTATPPLENQEVPSQLTELIGPVIFELSLSDLTGTYLSDFDYFTLNLSLTSEERFQYENEMNAYNKIHSLFKMTAPQGNYINWIHFASRTPEGRNALQAFRKAKRIVAYCKSKATILNNLLEKHWHQKVLIFTSDTEITYRIAKDHLIMPITSEIGRKEREQLLQYYRVGEIRALVSCRVLNEGLDVPDAEVAIITGGTSGAREHIQRIGRILRPYRGKKAVIYELVCQNTIEVHQSQKRSQSLGQSPPSSRQFSSECSKSTSQRQDGYPNNNTPLLYRERLSLDKAILQ